MSKGERSGLAPVLKDLAESSTIHGIPKISTSRYLYQKVLWCLLLTGLTGYLCYQLKQLFDAYYGWPVKTAVSLEFNTLQFPAITLCNMNPIKKDRLEVAHDQLRIIVNPTQQGTTGRKKRSTGGTYDTSTAVYETSSINTDPSSNTTLNSTINPSPTTHGTGSAYDNSWSFLQDSNYYSSYYSSSYQYDDYYASNSWYDSYSSYYSSYDHYYASETWEAPKNTWQARIEAFKNAYVNETREARDQMGHSLHDMLMSCSFATKTCYAENFTQITTADYGNCYTISSDKFITRRTGPLYGLWLTLNLEIYEYITNFAAAYGIRLVIHEPGTYPFPSEEGITLSPEYETTIGIKMINVSRLGSLYGVCNDGVDFKRNFGIRYTIPWTQSADEDCETQSKYPNELWQNVVEAKYERGDLHCPCESPCREILYTKTISGRSWPNEDYLRYALMVDMCSKNMTYMTQKCKDFNKNSSGYPITEFKQNFLNVMLYYEDLNYEYIREEPLYDGFRFMSDIGGTLGLFVGASLLSFTEIIQVLLAICNHIRKRWTIVDVTNEKPTGKGRPLNIPETSRNRCPGSVEDLEFQEYAEREHK